ncbi:MAG: hypothetical protein COB23_06925 [Methylophaga sp.]|nr:MAG: hypothetical protein COB23_06925 [Methylophaga sp.]
MWIHRYLGLGMAGSLILSASTGVFITFEHKVAQYGFLQGSIADKLLFLQLPLHSGKIFGPIGQGIMIWWKKHKYRLSYNTGGRF